MVTSKHLIIDKDKDSWVRKLEIFKESSLTLKMNQKTHGWTKQLRNKEINKGVSYRCSSRRVRILRQKLRTEIQNKLRSRLLCSMWKWTWIIPLIGKRIEKNKKNLRNKSFRQKLGLNCRHIIVWVIRLLSVSKIRMNQLQRRILGTI